MEKETNRKGPVKKLTLFCGECRYFVIKSCFGQKYPHCNEKQQSLEDEPGYFNNPITPNWCPYKIEEDEFDSFIEKLERKPFDRDYDPIKVIVNELRVSLLNRKFILANKLIDKLHDYDPFIYKVSINDIPVDLLKLCDKRNKILLNKYLKELENNKKVVVEK